MKTAVIIFFLFSSVLHSTKFASANPTAGSIVIESGFDIGLISASSSELEMTNADVIYDLNIKHRNFNILFDGTYTIHNPTNESKNFVLSAPFENFDEANCLITIDNIETTFETYIEEEAWGYITLVWLYFNLTLEEGESKVVRYTFGAQIKLDDDTTNFFMRYIISTGRSWSGKLNETVTFNIRGREPYLYSIFNEEYPNYDDDDDGIINNNCLVTDIDDGKSYQWGWENSRISSYEGYIMIAFSYRRLSTTSIYEIFTDESAFWIRTGLLRFLYSMLTLVAINGIVVSIYKKRMTNK